MSCVSSEKGVNLLRKKKFTMSCVALFLLAWSIGASGQEVQVVTSKGEGWFEGNDALIGKDRAVRDALAKAVEQAVGTMVLAETRVQNFQLRNDALYTKTDGFVQNYKIINENAGKNVYEVTIQATVSTGSITDKLDALGLLIDQVGKPRIMILIPEQNIGKQHYYYWWGH